MPHWHDPIDTIIMPMCDWSPTAYQNLSCSKAPWFPTVMLRLSTCLLCPPLPLHPLVTVNTHSLAEQLITVQGLSLEEQDAHALQVPKLSDAKSTKDEGVWTITPDARKMQHGGGGDTNNDYRVCLSQGESYTWSFSEPLLIYYNPSP